MFSFIQLKKMSVVLLVVVLPICSMDLPRKTSPRKNKGFTEISNLEENNLVVHFSRQELSDGDDLLVLAAAKNNILGLKSAADKMPKKIKKKDAQNERKYIICRAMYYAVKNNNEQTFQTLLSHKNTKDWAKSCLRENVSEFIQLAIINSSWQIMPTLIKEYLQNNAIEEDLFYDASPTKPQPDIFDALTKGASIIQKADFFEIIKDHHLDIMNMFKDQEANLYNYIETIKKLFPKKQVQILHSIAPFLNESPGNKEKCIIS